MSLFKVFDIAASSLTAQSQRLNAVASNLANAESVVSTDGQPYRAKQVVFSTVPLDGDAAGVRVTKLIEDPSPGRQVFDPKHPLANAQGYVTMPNVNVVEEMVNMISASRSYQTSVDLMTTTKSLALKTLAIGQ
ncbi:MAG TPA: flagellar basal body rod protein FlgC [Burkholderiales bacterium]|nr:flagellar basal body rod protein FlgC [Burkholderiales bacterium]